MKKQQTNKSTRRHFLKNASILTAASPFVTKLGYSQANRLNNKFVLYIHCGSWDGLTSGLLQPQKAGEWAKGLFFQNQSRPSVNPYVNNHYQSGPLVFNEYSRLMAPFANQMCFAVGNPQTLSHPEADIIQQSGAPLIASQPTWNVGLASAWGKAHGTKPTVNLGSNSPSGRSSNETSDVIVSEATNIDKFTKNFQDDFNIIPRSPLGNSFWQSASKINKTLGDLPFTNNTVTDQIANLTKQLVRGTEKLANDRPEIQNIRETISTEKINETIRQGCRLPETELATIEALATSDPTCRAYAEQLQLAAALIETGYGQGMSIGLAEEDLHSAGASSSISTTRHAARMWAGLNLFWQWVQAQGKSNDVMVIVSHEFSRGPYNLTRNIETLTTFDSSGRETESTIETYGTDHHLAHGMIFLNGKVPPESRLGNIVDNYTALGSSNLQGKPTSIAAYNSTDLVGSMFLRCFDDIFKNETEIRNVWQNFANPIDLLLK